MEVIKEYFPGVIKSIRDQMGDITDLSYELQNTLANVVYKKILLEKDITKSASGIPRSIASSNKIISTYKEYMKDAATIVTSYQSAPRLIEALREIRTENPALGEIIEEVTIDTLKYNINKAHAKTGLRRLIERKFKKVNEIPNLINLIST